MNMEQDSSSLELVRGFAAGRSLRPGPAQEPLQTEFLDSERRFYRSYPWCLNIFPTIRETVQHLRDELTRLDQMDEDWQHAEVMTNVFLLSSAIKDTVDDYLLGDNYDFSKATAVVPWATPVVRLFEKLLAASRKIRSLRARRVRQWRENWDAAVEDFLGFFVATARPNRYALSPAIGRLAALLLTELPTEVQRRRPNVPAAFRSQDLTHFDILRLGEAFVRAFPQREHPVLVVGIRTAGSYFAPLLQAYLRAQGYLHLDCVTIRPKNGIAPWEHERLVRGANRGAFALVLDEPANTGSTLAKGVDLLRRAGIAASKIIGLFPVHPSRRDWQAGHEFLPLSGIRILPLEPEQWFKHQLLQPSAVTRLVEEYFSRRGYAEIKVAVGTTAGQLNAQLQRRSEEKFHTRLKRIFEVQLRTHAGQAETRYILAKGVGWGWLGYHAFIASEELSSFVPPVLGLRDGILYTEWLLQDTSAAARPDRDMLLHSVASYMAARVRGMNLGSDPAPDLARDNRHRGFELLAQVLSKAYGWKLAAVLKRARIRHEVSRHACPLPTLIDGKMRAEEWIIGPGSLLKTDFEHHGLGKTKLNVTDPAYDLAEAVLYFRMSRGEESAFIHQYLRQTRDVSVKERLFFNKLLAGSWAMAAALDNLSDPRLVHRHQEFNQQYVDAWDFLSVHTMRFCAGLCPGPAVPRWHAPLVVMDIDGVLDKQIFGFPSTTAAGIHALALLHAHDVAIAVNTARTVSEVKEFCKAYGLVGGVAEYGSAIWDAVGGQELALVSAESVRQLELVRNALQQIPGVFLNDGYRHSIRAYTFERGVTVPLPTTVIRNLMTSLETDRLHFHQTYIDTAVLAKEIDKGQGLLALLDLAGQNGLETWAIGDSEPDLAMFRVTTRCFAPSQISCRPVAKLLGCQIAPYSYQRGLLSAVRSMLHPEGGRCDRCHSCERSERRPQDLFLKLLDASDQKPLSLLLRAVLDPASVKAFMK
jgi:hydroxymethylpyrimidine pyrophosphatase-like HAD family hydrolase